MVMIAKIAVGNGRQIQKLLYAAIIYLAKMVSSWMCEFLRPGCWSMERSRFQFQVAYSLVRRTPVSLIKPFRVASSNSYNLKKIKHALSLSPCFLSFSLSLLFFSLSLLPSISLREAYAVSCPYQQCSCSFLRSTQTAPG